MSSKNSSVIPKLRLDNSVHCSDEASFREISEDLKNCVVQNLNPVRSVGRELNHRFIIGTDQPAVPMMFSWLWMAPSGVRSVRSSRGISSIPVFGLKFMLLFLPSDCSTFLLPVFRPQIILE